MTGGIADADRNAAGLRNPFQRGHAGPDQNEPAAVCSVLPLADAQAGSKVFQLLDGRNARRQGNKLLILPRTS